MSTSLKRPFEMNPDFDCGTPPRAKKQRIIPPIPSTPEKPSLTKRLYEDNQTLFRSDEAPHGSDEDPRSPRLGRTPKTYLLMKNIISELTDVIEYLDLNSDMETDDEETNDDFANWFD